MSDAQQPRDLNGDPVQALNYGILAEANVSVAAPRTALVATPNARAMAFAVSVDPLLAVGVFIGGAAVTSTLFLKYVAPGETYVIDAVAAAMDTFYAAPEGAGPVSVSVTQVG